MQAWFKFMHSTAARVVRVAGGLWLVIYASELEPGYAFLLAAVGTAIAVTGIADICPMEFIVNATRARSKGAQRRAA
jgi:Protein of unknown function (DUF2892)